MRFSELAEILKRELGAEIAQRALLVICREARGESLYIPRHPEPPRVLPTDTPETIRQRHGVSRSTAYNWVTGWRR